MTATVNRAVTVKLIRAEEASAQPGHSRKVSGPHRAELNTRGTKKPKERLEYRERAGGVCHKAILRHCSPDRLKTGSRKPAGWRGEAGAGQGAQEDWGHWLYRTNGIDNHSPHQEIDQVYLN